MRHGNHGNVTTSGGWAAPHRTRPGVAATSLLLAVGVSMLLTLGACGGDPSGNEGATPGFEGQTPEMRDGRFELAQPSTTAGPTTISGDAPSLLPTTTEPPRSTTTEPARPTGTTPPLETTTTIPGVIVPDTASITSVCGMFESVFSFFAQPDPGPGFARFGSRLLINLDRYVQLAPPELRADTIEVRSLARRLIDLFDRAGGDLSNPELTAQIEALKVGAPPYQDSVAAMLRIDQWESVNCS